MFEGFNFLFWRMVSTSSVKNIKKKKKEKKKVRLFLDAYNFVFDLKEALNLLFKIVPIPNLLFS